MTTVTTTQPLHARPGDVLRVNGEDWVVKSSIACEVVVRPARWYDRVRWAWRSVVHWLEHQRDVLVEAYWP